MVPNPRQLVIHHDDLGGSHSANLAFTELVGLGVVTCGSVVVPGPWFTEVAEMSNRRPDLDIGVHLTLTSEFQTFRWRPLTSGTSLVDASGYFHRDISGARTADTEEVRTELRAQVQCALDSGIDVTHLDSHMGTAWQPEFIQIYLDLGNEFGLPIVVTQDIDRLSAPHTDPASIFQKLKARNNPEFCRFLTTPFGNPNPTIADYETIFDEAAPGLNWCGFHFAGSGDIEFITSDATTRIAEYDLFRSGAVSRIIESGGFELIGMRPFREQMRS